MRYLHIGQNLSLKISDVIALFDTDNATVSALTRRALAEMESDGRVVPCDGIPRSMILAWDRGEERLYLSVLSAGNIARRIEQNL